MFFSKILTKHIKFIKDFWNFWTVTLELLCCTPFLHIILAVLQVVVRLATVVQMNWSASPLRTNSKCATFLILPQPNFADDPEHQCSHTGASLVWAVICRCEQLLNSPSVVIPQHLSKRYLHFPALYSGLVSLKLYPPNIMYQILVNNLIIHKLRVDVICSYRTSAGCPSKSLSTKLRILNLELSRWTFTSVCSPGPVGTLRQATLMV